MKVEYSTFMSRDIERTIEFYEKLAGLKVVRRFNPGMGEIAFMANGEGETMLEFIQFDKAEKVSVKGMVMAFHTDMPLDALRAKAIELGYAPSEIIDVPPKPAHFTVADPDGLVVEFSV